MPKVGKFLYWLQRVRDRHALPSGPEADGPGRSYQERPAGGRHLHAGCRAGTLCVSFPPVTAPPGTGEHGSVHPRSAVGSCAACGGTECPADDPALRSAPEAGPP
jgi:hypothetical protein